MNRLGKKLPLLIIFCQTLFFQTDPGMCGCVVQQWVAFPGYRSYGAGPDGHPGDVEQGQLPQTTTTLQQRCKFDADHFYNFYMLPFVH